MQSAEEFAASILGCEVYRQPTWADGTPGESWCRTHRHKPNSWPCPEQSALTDLIRERDAEVRADERAKVLAGFTEEWSLVDAKGFHYFKVGDPPPEDGLRPVRRHVSPWEPTP